MRIAYVTTDPGVPAFGRKGCSVHVVEVLRAMRRAGHDVTLLAARLDGPPPPDLADVPVVALPRPRGSAAEREQAALVGNAVVARALSRLSPDLVYERHALWSTGAMTHAQATRTPSVLEVNAPLLQEQARHRTLVDGGGARRCAVRALRTATRVIAVSDPVAGWARSLGAADVRTVPNGVDADRLAPAVRADRLDHSCTIGFVGTLKPWHGVEVLAEAFARAVDVLPHARLRIIGDGPLRPALQDRLAPLADRVELLGSVPPDAVPRLLREVDVAVAPYPAHAESYFSPLKVLEYQAAAVPVVASAVGQIPELLGGGTLGALVRPGDASALVQAVCRLAADPAAARATAARGRAHVRATRSWDAVLAASLDGIPHPHIIRVA